MGPSSSCRQLTASMSRSSDTQQTSRVSRVDLEAHAFLQPSASLEHDPRRLFLERYPVKHGFKTVATASSRRSQPHPQPQSQSQSQSPLKSRIQDDDEGYDFKLFAPRPDSAHAAVTRIRLDSPETAAAQPGLLRQHPRNHY